MINKNDYNAPRSFKDLMLRINGINRNIESNSQSLVKVNSELNNITKSILINLKDALDSQSELSLWFYNATPTTQNAPYTNWINPSDHYGDLYYDIGTGKVYQYNQNKGWEEKINTDIVQALALTNSKADTTEDHERKIYFNQPLPAYSNGDWWIKNDGTLFICQISKNDGQSFENSDWIDANNYTDSVSTKLDDIIKVLKGTITIINDNFAKFTDLATGDSTIINGANIKTGIINADLVSISNDLVQIGSYGIKLGNGAQIIGDDGLKNLYTKSEIGNLGFMYLEGSDESKKQNIIIDYDIPENITVTKAYIRLLHSPVYWSMADLNTGIISYSWGYSQNIKLYKCTNVNSRLVCSDYGGSAWADDDTSTYEEISNAFGPNGYTPEQIPSNTAHDVDIKNSTEIILSPGLNRFKLETSNPLPNTKLNCAKATGGIIATLVIEGFVKYNNEEGE